MKMALNDPSMAAGALGIEDSETYVKEVFLNWHINYFLLSYEINQLSEQDLRNSVRDLFKAEAPRKWWSWSRNDWRATASRQEKEFFAIVDSEFQRAKQIAESAATDTTPPDGAVNFPPPCS
jgi:hypothetical protein